MFISTADLIQPKGPWGAASNFLVKVASLKVIWSVVVLFVTVLLTSLIVVGIIIAFPSIKFSLSHFSRERVR
jgi:hypothetical protein